MKSRECPLLERSAGGCRRLAALVLSLLPVVLGTISCGGRGPAVGAVAPEPESTQPSLFRVPENQLPRLQIRPAQKRNWVLNLRTTGTVDWDADRTTQAITQVSGPITKILVDTGSAVREGDPLLYVASPDVTNAVATYRKAKNRLDFEAKLLERNKDLLAHRVIAQRDLESVEADYNDASTDLLNALQALKIFGVAAADIDEAQRQGAAISPQLAVRSPISGIVIQKFIFPGQLIQAGATTCFAITDVSRVWIQGHIYEGGLASVHVGDSVEATNSSIPGTFRGVISYIGAMVDPATRTTPVRIATGNPKGLLKKDLIMDAVIHTRAIKNVLTVPTSAVLYDPDSRPFVYVQAEANQFAQRMVVTGAQQNGEFEISSGLQDGEKIVTEGSIFLQFANTYQR